MAKIAKSGKIANVAETKTNLKIQKKKVSKVAMAPKRALKKVLKKAPKRAPKKAPKGAPKKAPKRHWQRLTALQIA